MCDVVVCCGFDYFCCGIVRASSFLFSVWRRVDFGGGWEGGEWGVGWLVWCGVLVVVMVCGGEGG